MSAELTHFQEFQPIPQNKNWTKKIIQLKLKLVTTLIIETSFVKKDVSGLKRKK